MTKMRFPKSGRLEHSDVDETPWMANAICGMSEGQARLVSRWSEIRASGSDSQAEQRDQPEHSLSTVIVDGCVNLPRSPRRRDSSPRSTGSSRSRDQQQSNAAGRTAADAMRALQVMAQKHEEYKGQIAHLKQQLTSVLSKSRSNERSLNYDEMAKKSKDAQDMINSLRQELSATLDKSRKTEEKFMAMHEKMKVISKKHEEYVEQIASLKQQLTSAQSEKDKSKEESLDMVNNFDFIAKKNEKYREQILGLKKQLAQAQDEVNSAKEASEAREKEIGEMKVDNESLAAFRQKTEEFAREKKQLKEKESFLREELTSARNKVKKEEEKIMKLYGKIQDMKRDQNHDQERAEKQKETINSLSRQLECIHAEYKVEIDKLRSKDKGHVCRYFQTVCFNALLLGSVFVVCLAIPTYMGHELFGPQQAMYLAMMGGGNILLASLMSIKFKRQVKFKKQPTTKILPPLSQQLTTTTSSSLSTNNITNMLQQQIQRRGNHLVKKHLQHRRSNHDLEKTNSVDSNDERS